MTPENCEWCPVPGNAKCPGLAQKRGCHQIRDGRPGRKEQFYAVATGTEMPMPAEELELMRIRIDAEACRWAKGACGCGKIQRDCNHPDPDRPRKVWFTDCVKCKTDQRLSDLGSKASATARPSA